jgi:hypothetical protein
LTVTTILKGKRWNYKTPVIIDFPKPKSDLERILQEKVLVSLKSKMSRMIPFAIESPAHDGAC